MKLCVFILLGVVMQAFCNKSYSQEARLTLELRNTTVEEVLNQIENQTEFYFLFNKKLVDINRMVSVSAKNTDISKVLNQIFRDQDIAYVVNDRQIVLMKKGLPAIPQSSAKERAVSGVVQDKNGESLIGANVRIKGTHEGVTTDINGRFSVNVSDQAVLEISFIGYVTQEVAVAGKKELVVVLQEDSKQLDEVVVIGFGVQKKANLTGAVSVVKMDDVLGDRPVNSVTSALQGLVPGMQITKGNGTPGEAMALNIRGTTSINGGSPLILVDNVPMDINMVDPAEIESISVLKDAASSAIYGARAAFGVVLITTKKGKKNQPPRFTYSNNFAFSSPTELPRKASPWESVQAYKTMGFTNDTYVDGSNILVWEGLLQKYREDPSAYPEGYARINGQLYGLAENDMVGDMMEDYGFQQIHNFSVSGGTEKSMYRLAFGYTDENGILITNKDTYKRYNLSAFWGIDVTPWLMTSLDIKYANSKKKTPTDDGVRNGIWGSAMALPSFVNTKDVEINGKVYQAESSRTALLNLEPKRENKGNFRAFGKMVLKPVKGLEITGEYTYNRTNSLTRVYNRVYEYAGRNMVQILKSFQNSFYSVNQGYTNYNAANLYATYKLNLNNHDLMVMGGYNQESSYSESQFSSTTDVLTDDLPSLSLGTGTKKTSDGFNEYAVRGLFFRLNYAYADRYLLEVSGRYDGSSRFPKNDRFGFFPSFSVGWRASEEKFMDWSKAVVSNLRLYANWGQIGNQTLKDGNGNVMNYPYIPGMDTYLSSWLVGGEQQTTLRVPAMVSGSFTWETVQTLDIGIDLGLFQNRLTAGFDWYRRDTKDMLAPGMELPAVVGSAPAKQNAANLKSVGWELQMNWQDRIGDWNYRLGFNLYDSQAEITKFDNKSGLLGNHYVGKKMNEIWGYTTDRFYREDDFMSEGVLKDGIPKFKGANKVYPGDVLYVDYDGNGEINVGENSIFDSGDRRVIGNSTRRYQYGVTGGVGWKGIDFSFILTGVGKRDLWLLNDYTWPGFKPWGAFFKHQLDFWTPENPNAFFPRVYANAGVNSNYNSQVQTKYMQNGAYVRLRNITLSYTLPKEVCSKIHFESIKVFFSGENLHTWHHLAKGLDPEQIGKQRGWTYPFMKQYSFGVNVTF